MRRLHISGQWAIGMLCFLTVQAFALAPRAAGPTLHVEPPAIQIGTFYAGTQVQVSAEIPTGSDAVIEMLGKDIEEQLLRKGQHWDIWMNVGEIDIEGAPSVYYATSSDPESLARSAPNPAFGYGALQQRTTFLGDVRGLRNPVIFDEFVMLKESERLYRVDPGKLERSSSPEGSTVIRGTFAIPSRIAAGTYTVRLSVLQNGLLVATRSTPLEVRVVGLPALLSGLARSHGGLYGLLAVAVAVVFGYATGVAFKRTRPARRKSNTVKATVEHNEGE